MTLFMNNINSDLLVAIEYTKILFKSNYGVESVVFDISNKEFGTVTQAAKSIVGNTQAGRTLSDAVLFEKTLWQQKNMQSFLSALASSSNMDISRRLSDLTKHIVAEKKLYVDNFIDDLKAKLGKFVLLMAVPLLVYFLTELSTETFEEMINLTPALKNTIYIATLAGSVVIMFVILIGLRYKE